MGDSDPTIQEVTLDCLLNWKDNYLTSYESHLKNIVSSKAIREELTTWNVGKESHEIKDEDRQPLLTVVLMLLFPRIMRRTVKSLGKVLSSIQNAVVPSLLYNLLCCLYGVFGLRISLSSGCDWKMPMGTRFLYYKAYPSLNMTVKFATN